MIDLSEDKLNVVVFSVQYQQNTCLTTFCSKNATISLTLKQIIQTFQDVHICVVLVIICQSLGQFQCVQMFAALKNKI